MRVPQSTPAIFLLCLFSAASAIIPARAEDWLPITHEELKMTSEPKAPGAPAIYLYRQVDRDDNGPREYDYARIKILTEEGRRYADVVIPYRGGTENIHGIQARTIRPDGSTVNFDGSIYTKTIVKAKGISYLAQTLTMPDVQVGSIIEYRYIQDFEAGYVFDSHWILSEELFTKRAKFSLKQYTGYSLRWSWPCLPEGTKPPSSEHGIVHLETSDVPAFQVEDYMPPENELKCRVDFIYITSPNPEQDMEKFWKQVGAQWYREGVDFVDKRKAMGQAVSQMVQPSDAPEEKLRKIYARVQQIRNFSSERDKSEKELKREKLRGINNVEDVWKRGYGDALQINWLFVALARAAGVQADAVYVSTRDAYFFNPKLMNPGQLNTSVVVVRLDGKDVYLDPAAAFTPFGLLPWNETWVRGLRPDKDGGTWIKTPLPAPNESRIERKAVLKLSDSGSLEGKLTVTYTGEEALWRRVQERDEDDIERKTFLENQIKEYIPGTAEAQLNNQPDWKSSATTLVAEYDLKVPDWGAVAGHRVVLSAGLFNGMERHTFEHADRVHPIYFSFPYQREDDVIIDLPAGWQASNLPQAQNIDLEAAAYRLTAEKRDGALHVKRELTLNLEVVETSNYPTLRSFFQNVRTGDEQQIVVSTNSAAGQN
jgi:Domain of Unknown Function with PDB structure (DUF3857)/Domain of Unknown Function with PDB structure (DUF3858)/Transglutaminase-like superfamily